MAYNLNMHLAEINDATNTRLVVLLKQNPNDPQNALVVQVDSLTRTVDRDELMALVRGNDAQKEMDLINVLHKKRLLTYYHENKFITPMSIDRILMTPGNSQKIPLRDIINGLNAQKGLAPLPTTDQLNSLSDANPLASQKKSDLNQNESKSGIARSLIIQAQMMNADVQKKVQQALELDPAADVSWFNGLNNASMKRPTSKQDDSIVVPKRPRGRPSKASTASS